MKKPIFSGKFRDSCLTVANQIYGRKGIWAYESFDYINGKYFADRLPYPFIIWGLTPHGGCVGWTRTRINKSISPVINLHPSLLGGTEKEEPWGFPETWLGQSMAFDTLLHECIHVHIDFNLGGSDGRTSHDCDEWATQVNRIAPLMGFDDVKAGRSKSVRVPDPSAPLTITGKVATVVTRKQMGNLPMIVLAGFPQSLRMHREEAEAYYTAQSLPPGAPTLYSTKHKADYDLPISVM